MKKARVLILIFVVLINICCGNKSFDLSSVSLGDDAKKYDFENKDLFLKDAYRNNAVFGLKYPTPPASPWYKYMN